MNQAIVTLVSPQQEVQSYHVDVELFMQIWTLLNDGKQPMIDSLDKPILVNPVNPEPERVSVSDIETTLTDGQSYPEFTIEHGTKPGYVEIIFDTKPAQPVIDDLKSAGFRWSVRNKLWYGLADRLPAVYSDYLPEPVPTTRVDQKPAESAPDKPIPGKIYALTGGDKCIANGDTWNDSEVKETKESDDSLFARKLADMLAK